jgi:putative ABC transport system permease protein
MTRHLLRLVWNRKRTTFLITLEVFVSFLALFLVTSIAVYSWSLYRRPLGFDYARVWRVDIDMKSSINDDWTPQQIETVRQLMIATRDLPDVESIAAAEISPFDMGNSSSAYNLHGQRIEYRMNEVSDGFRDVVALHLVEGRWFGPDDDALPEHEQSVVITEPLRRHLFGNGTVLGQNIGAGPDPDSHSAPEVLRVVGVVEDFREGGEFDTYDFHVLFRKRLAVTTNRNDRPAQRLLIRVRPGTTSAYEETLVKELGRVAHDWSFSVAPLVEIRERTLKFSVIPLIVCGLVAGFLMLMVALGLTGVLWQTVTERTREIGLRRATGATALGVQRQVLTELLLMTTMAVVFGVALALQLPLVSPLYWIPARVYFVGLAVAVVAIYLLTLACGWYPSRMATRVDPAEALRYE